MENINSKNFVEDLFTENCIRTFGGVYMNVFEPTADMIYIEDIAHALAHQCRFGGHLPKWYSVAQHSILCSRIVPKEFKFQALMHDASEAYLLDFPSPIKKKMDYYKEVENKLMLAIAAKFEFKYPLSPEVKEADAKMLQWEWDHLMLQIPTEDEFICLSPEKAEEAFINEFLKLSYKG